jgi:ent-kaurene oxidase
MRLNTFQTLRSAGNWHPTSSLLGITLVSAAGFRFNWLPVFTVTLSGAPERGSWSGKALRIGIHQNLREITSQLDRHIQVYLAQHITGDVNNSQSIKLIDFFVPAISSVNNKILVDDRLASDIQWVQATAAFAKNRYDAADDVRAWPPMLAAIVAPLLPSVRQMKASKAMVRDRLEPLYDDLRVRDLLGKEKRETRRKGSFGYEWLWEGAPKDVTLPDFSDTMMRTLIASIHTTAKTVSIALIDLLSQPNYIDELREEALAATKPDGKVDVEKLIRLDCFLKESQRLQPVFLRMYYNQTVQPQLVDVSKSP